MNNIPHANLAVLYEGMDAFVTRREIPGYALALHYNGDDCRYNTDAEDAIYRLMSMSKPVTAVAIMQLVESGRMRLEDPVSQYLPADSRLTILHLLNHTSGWGMDDNPMYNQITQQEDTLAGRVRGWCDIPLAFEPGTQTGYSGMVAFDVLGRIVELVSGCSFQDYLVRNIFDPLAMPDTRFILSAAQRARVVRIYEAADGTLTDVTDTQSAFARIDGNVLGYYSGAAGLYGTLADYTRFVAMLAQQGRLDGAQILRPETVLAMRTATLQPGVVLGPGMRWGIGMLVHDADSPLPMTPESYGWSGAFGTHFWIDPRRQLYAVFMTNVSNIGGAGSHVSRALEQLVYAALDL